jgi:Na+/melibiose symporter-like transporter
VTAKALSRSQLAAYSLFSVPLAMAALPVYVHAPKLYAGELGMPLALVGAILLVARLFDAFQDPLLGFLSDRCTSFPLGRGMPVILGLPFLGAGFVGLFNPPVGSQTGLALWLTVNLMVVHVGFSAASISYFSMGAELSDDYHERTRVTATRSAFGLLGVLVAAAVPGMLGSDLGGGLALFALLFVPVLIAAAFVTLRYAPRPAIAAVPKLAWRSILLPLGNMQFRWLLGVFVLSGVAGAIPGTLILFFVEDVVRRPDLAGMFLALYFVFGALGMPLWIAVSRRLGKRNTWTGGMVMALLAFVWAYFLQAGDVIPFACVCVLSGVAYGAELAIPPSMLADVVDPDTKPGGQRPDGVYFGLWQTIEKFNLAAAAGIALPLLAWAGYAPGGVPQQTGGLSAVYALLPCAIKLGAAGLLWVAPLDRPACVAINLKTEAEA